MKASDYIAAFLAEQGVTHVFEVVGGMITHLVDSLHRQDRIRIVSVHHEQAAAFAADAHARVRGVPGVALATSGPGATNLLTGIGSCYFDSAPAVFITGQVNRHEQKGDRPVRQLGFQETDIVAMARPITKDAWMVRNVADLPAALARAFALACEGRPGPVLLDVPMDVQNESVPDDTPIPGTPDPKNSDRPNIAASALAPFLADLRQAQRPLLLVGGGLMSARAHDRFPQAVEKLGIPVVNSLMAVDALPWNHPLRVGFIGSYGNRWANCAIGESDFLLVLGSRLDVRQTGADTRAFKGDRTIYQVDIDPGETNNRVTGCHTIIAHLRDFLDAVAAEPLESPPGKHEAWEAHLRELRERWPDASEYRGDPAAINPHELFHDLSEIAADAAAYVSDVGQHQMWCAQSLRLHAGQRFFNTGGMGAMGFGLPAAIGTAFAYPGKPVVLVAGDGGFQLNLQELQTVARNRLSLKIILLNNQCHGMVRQFQQSYFEERYPSTAWGYSAPDFARVSEAYGIRAGTVKNPGDMTAAFAEAFAQPDAPYLLQVMIDPNANVYPKIAFGHPLTEMEPFAKPIQMEST